MAEQTTPPENEAASDPRDNTEFTEAFAEFAEEPESEPERDEEPERPPPETETQPEPEPAPEDPWAKVPADLKAQYEAAQRDRQYWSHRYQSDIGRITAYQNKIKELEEQVKETAQSGESQAAPSQRQVQAALDDPKKWDSFAEDYPEVAEAVAPLRTRLNTLQEQFQSLRQQLSPIEANHRQQQIHAGLNVVAHVHPDWETVVKHPAFHNWLGQQTPAIQALANSDDPNEAIAALDYFKSWAYRTNARSAPPPAAPAADPADRTVEQIQRRRERQLEQMETVPNRGQAAQQTVPPDDFEAAFNAFARARER